MLLLVIQSHSVLYAINHATEAWPPVHNTAEYEKQSHNIAIVLHFAVGEEAGV